MPTVAEARDGPASRIASVNRTCETPGPRIPASANGQTAATFQSPAIAAATSATPSAGMTVRSAPHERVVAAGERRPQRDRHRAEERGRAEREDDRVHQAGSGRPRASRRSVAAAAGSASTIPASITAQPAQPSDAEPLRQEQHAEERGERRLEREHERRPRGGRARLHPGRDEVAERAGEDAGDDERVPDGAAVGQRRARLARAAITANASARDGHLQERERAGVVPRREPLHRDDLERLGDGVAEHERVAERRAARHAVQQQQPGDGERDPDPGRGGDRRAEERRARCSGVSTT